MASLRYRKEKLGIAGVSGEGEADPDGKSRRLRSESEGRSGVGVVGLVAVICLGLAVNYMQTEVLPKPLPAEEAGRLGFSEERAFSHLTVLTSFGPRPVGSEALDHAVEYVLHALEKIKNSANPNVYVEVDDFRSKQGMNRLHGGLFKGKTLAYADLRHVLVRLSSKFSADAEDNAILVSSHIDTVYTSPGGGDCGSCVSVMLELVRALSQSAQSFKHSVIFLFNTGEEEGLDGAHSFITQHPWNSSVRTFVDLEAMGAGGKSFLFQAGPDKWLLDVFAKTVRYPAANILAQDVFQAGLFKSATDFQVYKEVAGLSGLDFAYVENGAVYHTRNDAIKLVRAGSLQQLGDNMLPLLSEVARSPDLAHVKPNTQNSKPEMVYFDILSRYMVTFTQEFARTLYSSILLQSLLLFAGSLVRAKSFAVTGLALAAFSILVTWISALTFSVGVAALVPKISSHPVPYVAHPLLAVGLFGSSALFGAVVGHSVGHTILSSYLKKSISNASPTSAEAEKVMFKAVFLQWLLVLALGLWSSAGSSYIAAAWLVIPAIAYGMKESSLSKNRPSRHLSSWTLFLGLPLPVMLCADIFFNLPKSLIGNLVRIERNPGALSPFVGNAVIAVVIAAIVCCLVSYLLPYIHRRGDKIWILLSSLLIFALSISAVTYQVLPAFTKDVGKGTYVVHVIEATNNSPQSYMSVSFTTPGGLENEARALSENGFTCGDMNKPDFVTFKVFKGCVKTVQLDNRLWQNRPTLTVVTDQTTDDQRITNVVLDSKQSHRWSMAIDTRKIQAIQVDASTDQNPTEATEVLVPEGRISGEDGWHIMQFASGRNGPRKFNIKLVWERGSPRSSNEVVIKVRTDLDIFTQDAATTVQLLPDSCALFGKSTSPFSLAYLLNLVTDP